MKRDLLTPLSCLTLTLCGACVALGIDIRNSPADYPVRASAPDFEIGVEYLVRTFPDEQPFLVDDYLIVEIGLFPKGHANVDLRRFSLRLNGKNVLSQTPGMVAASLKYPDWSNTRPTLQAGIGTPGGGIILGRRPNVGRFPGDPTQDPAPREPQGSISPRQNPVVYEAIVKRHALPEGRMDRPVAGLIFFPYTGKLKSLKKVELLVDDVVLKLR